MRRHKGMLEDLDQDIRDHIERETQDNIDRGMPPEEARYAALRKFGNVTRVKEETREVWRFGWLEQLGQDIRYGLRMLHKNPGFTAVAVLTLALGIGANTAIFSVVNAVLIHPLPYSHPERIVFLSGAPVLHSTPKATGSYGEIALVDWFSHTRSFENTAIYETGEVNMAGANQPERIKASQVSVGFFRTLGVQPRGRAFLPDESVPGRGQIAILGESLCHRFGAPDDVIGRDVLVNGMKFTVVGVMPAGFTFPGKTQIWLPLPLPWTFEASHIIADTVFFTPIARLRPGVTLTQARDEVLRVAFPASDAESTEMRKGFEIKPLREALVGSDRPVLWLLLGAVAFVLLIACADVANLLLAHAVAREREMTLRAALGASRLRLIGQNLAESLLLSGLGGLAGLLLAALSLGGIRLLVPSNIPLAAPIRIDGAVLAFTLAVSLASGLLFGLFPSLHAYRSELSASLKEGGRLNGAARGRLGHTRSLLTVMEGALSVVLLVGAGLLIRSFARLDKVNPGFDTQRLLTTQVNLAEGIYQLSAKRNDYYESVLQRVAALPGVRNAAFTSNLPLSGAVVTSAFELQVKEASNQPPPVGDSRDALLTAVSPSYFRTMGIPLLAGRLFEDGDRDGSPKVAIVSESLARAFLGTENPLGKHVSLPITPPDWCEIVAVVGDTRHAGLSAEPSEELYLPLRQNASPAAFLVIRTEGAPALIGAEVRRAVAEVDRNEPLSGFVTMQEHISNSMAPSRFRTVLLSTFAALALTLAVVGLYGVISYTVSRRTHEIGVRMAIGARREDVLKLVLGQAFGLTLLGVGIGIISALVLTRLLSSLLYGVKPGDPLTFIIVGLMLTGVAVLAGYIPARRATKVDPMVALRDE
jgi:predicted permease